MVGGVLFERERRIAAIGLLLGGLGVEAAAQERGLVLDVPNQGAFAFDVAGTRLYGSVPMTGQGDCVIDQDGRLGYATDGTSRVWVIDVASFPVALAPGTNAISISNRGADVSLTPDEIGRASCRERV